MNISRPCCAGDLVGTECTKPDSDYSKCFADEHQVRLLIRDCEDGDAYLNETYQKWLGRLRQFVSCQLGSAPRSNIFCYTCGGTLMAFDLEAATSTPTDRKEVSITVNLTDKGAALDYPRGSELALALPGIIDALEFVGLVLSPEPFDIHRARQKPLFVSVG